VLVLIDANVLFSKILLTVMLDMANNGLFTFLWSKKILSETSKNLKLKQKISNTASVDKLIDVIQKWVYSLETIGLEETRKSGGKGLHDEPLKGEMVGMRSIRLNRSWRLYYRLINGVPKIVTIERVDKHKHKY
jgi:proteic killer suppression protein